jgi:hypothetical protein
MSWLSSAQVRAVHGTNAVRPNTAWCVLKVIVGYRCKSSQGSYQKAMEQPSSASGQPDVLKRRIPLPKGCKPAARTIT